MEPGEVVEALAHGRFDAISAAADDNFRGAVPTAEIERVWRAAVAELGAFDRASPGVVLHDVALAFARGDGHLQIAYRDGVIVGLVLRDGPPTGRFGG